MLLADNPIVKKLSITEGTSNIKKDSGSLDGIEDGEIETDADVISSARVPTGCSQIHALEDGISTKRFIVLTSSRLKLFNVDLINLTDVSIRS